MIIFNKMLHLFVMEKKMRLCLTMLLLSCAVQKSIAAPAVTAKTQPISTQKVSSKATEQKSSVESGAKLDIAGFTAIGFDFVSQSNRGNNMSSPDSHISIGASNLFFNIKGNGFGDYLDKFGFVVVFEAYPGASKYVSQNYVELAGKWGTFHFGNVSGVEDRMSFSGNSLIEGANGLDGTLPKIVNIAEGLNASIGMNIDTSKALKLSYYTPTWRGFQLGVSFTPHTAAGGRYGRGKRHDALFSTGNDGVDMYPNRQANAPYGTNNVSLGLNYAWNKDDFGFKVVAIWMMEKSNYAVANNSGNPYPTTKMPINHGKAYQLGAGIQYKDFQFAIGFVNNLNSRVFKDGFDAAFPDGADKSQNLASQEGSDASKGNAGHLYNAAVAYKRGAWNFALGYNRMERKTSATDKSKGDLVTGTIDFQAARGLIFFLEVDYFRSDASKVYTTNRQRYFDDHGKKIGRQPIESNSAKAIIIGTKVRF